MNPFSSWLARPAEPASLLRQSLSREHHWVSKDLSFPLDTWTEQWQICRTAILACGPLVEQSNESFVIQQAKPNCLLARCRQASTRKDREPRSFLHGTRDCNDSSIDQVAAMMKQFCPSGDCRQKRLTAAEVSPRCDAQFKSVRWGLKIEKQPWLTQKRGEGPLYGLPEMIATSAAHYISWSIWWWPSCLARMREVCIKLEQIVPRRHNEIDDHCFECTEKNSGIHGYLFQPEAEHE